MGIGRFPRKPNRVSDGDRPFPQEAQSRKRWGSAAGFQPAVPGFVVRPARACPCPSPDARCGHPGLHSLGVSSASPSWLAEETNAGSRARAGPSSTFCTRRLKPDVAAAPHVDSTWPQVFNLRKTRAPLHVQVENLHPLLQGKSGTGADCSKSAPVPDLPAPTRPGSEAAGEGFRLREHEGVAVVARHDHHRVVPGVVLLDPVEDGLHGGVARPHRADRVVDVVGV
jgi:hypothetical protein